ncbi:hypothetical protein UlMin_028996 [Ulmus minor]
MKGTRAGLGLTIFMVAISLVSFGNNRVLGQCNMNVSGLISECAKYVSKEGKAINPPSPSCCAVVKPIDVPCACKYVNKKIENLVDTDKVVYVARTCGLQVPIGMKCGSFTVPNGYIKRD